MPCSLNSDEIKRLKAMGFLHNRDSDNFSGRVLTVNGKISARQNMCIAEAAEKFGCGEVSFTSRLTVEIPGIHYSKVDDFCSYIAQSGLSVGGTGSRVRPVVACKGSTCTYGLCDAFELAKKIHHHCFEVMGHIILPHKFKIAVGGCPNNCVKPDLNDLGIVGQLKPAYDASSCGHCKNCRVERLCPMKAASYVAGAFSIDSSLCNNCGLCIKSCPFSALSGKKAYKIYLGGRWGKLYARGIAMKTLLYSEDELLPLIERVIIFFKNEGKPKERFAETIARIGFDNVEKALTVD